MPLESFTAYPMGEAKLGPRRVNFDRRLNLKFHGSDIISDDGVIPYRSSVTSEAAWASNFMRMGCSTLRLSAPLRTLGIGRLI